jgi:hypothetical protein
MQLNNKTTHEILVINRITNGIIFDKFTNDLRLNAQTDSVIWELEKTQKTGTKTIADFELLKAYEHLISLPEYSDFEISTGKNWKFADEIMRLIVDKNKLTPHLLDNDAVGQLVSYVLADPTIKQKTIDTLDGFIYIYLKFISPDHLPIIQNADCIVIDNM